MRLTRPRPARVAWWIVGLTLLALFVVGGLGAGIMPSWGSSCPGGGECDLPALRSLVIAAWVVHGIALTGLAGGMFAVGRTRPESPEGDGITDEHEAGPWRHALLATGFVAVTNAITAGALGIAMLLGAFMVGAVVAAWWVGLTVFLDALDRLCRPHSDRRGSWWRALAVSSLTVAMLWVLPVLVVGVEQRGWSEAFLIADVLVAGAAGLGTLWSRLADGGPREGAVPHRQRVVAVAAAGSLALPIALVVSTDLDSGTRVRAGELLGDLLNPYPGEVVAGPEPTPTPTPSPEPTPGPTPTGLTTPTPTTPSTPACTPEDLVVTVAGDDRGLSAATMSIVVISTSEAACTVEGYPELRLADSSDEVALAVMGVDHSFDGEEVAPQTLTLEPGDVARSVAWWRERPPGQTLEGTERALAVGLGGVEDPATGTSPAWMPVVLADDVVHGLTDGSRVRIEPWRAVPRD
ncbi:DUF4232 domain-containing protein [Janibacter sp. YIM B02568]|uniref:DUF4232 domain-containing protein n=1 Tax=Janibacter endophyticus TaxID=2806261 RepID=UPI00194F7D7D|nr:DUF4232 domain-containing protein [Janibacter endophyticus]MBM6545144.1 DUF4232 domain-containing protein [Janibacter endophyticus]